MNFATGVIESQGVLKVASLVKIRLGIESGHLVAEPIEQSFLSDGEWKKNEVRSQYQEIIVPITNEFRDKHASQEKRETIMHAIDRGIQSAVEEVTPLETIAYVSLIEEAMKRKAKLVKSLQKLPEQVQESIGTYSLKSLINNKMKRAEIINRYFNKNYALYLTNKNLTVFSLAA